MNDLRFVADVVVLLRKAGIDTWIFGGWAEELLGLARPREHQDLDLLYVGDDWRIVDEFTTRRGLSVTQRSPHKRAFVLDDVLVQVLLVQHDEQGYVTRFPTVDYRWSEGVVADAGVLPVADLASVVAYRRDRVARTKPAAAA